MGLGITFFVLFAYYLEPSLLKFMELKSLDLKFQACGHLKPGDEVVIAAIDDKSLDELGRWPWSRDIQAKLVNTLAAQGARVIAYNAVFSPLPSAST